jgi:hypothetical protein
MSSRAKSAAPASARTTARPATATRGRGALTASATANAQAQTSSAAASKLLSPRRAGLPYAAAAAAPSSQASSSAASSAAATSSAFVAPNIAALMNLPVVSEELKAVLEAPPSNAEFGSDYAALLATSVTVGGNQLPGESRKVRIALVRAQHHERRRGLLRSCKRRSHSRRPSRPHRRVRSRSKS